MAYCLERFAATIPFSAQAMKASLCSLLAACMLFGNGVSAEEGPNTLQIVIEPEKQTVFPYDPIIVRVSFLNDSETAIQGASSPTAANGFLKFEIRKKDEQQYRRVVSRTENLTSNSLRIGIIELFAPHARRSTIAIISETPIVKVFEGPGTYELRAFLRDSDAYKGISKPIEIVVGECSSDYLQHAERASGVVASGTGGGLPLGATRETYSQAVDDLPDCELKRTGTMLADLAVIRDANTRDGFAESAGPRRCESEESPRATQDWIAITLAKTFYSMKRLDLAKEEIERLSELSIERETLQRLIKQAQAVPNRAIPVQ